MIKKILTTLFGLLIGLGLFAVALVAVAILLVYPNLPSLEKVRNYQPKEPLKIYSSDNVLIGLYGEERREFTKIQEFPDILKKAVLAAEDKRFYEHWGVDVIGVSRAIVGNIIAGELQSGASTITQQVAKNFLLTNERTFERKFKEALLAYKIEQSLTKDQILELYFNQIYLGQRAYGFAAASQVYFNKKVKDLNLAEAAMLAGLPKAPSAYNPIVNPERARQRQQYILNNMLELGWITQAQHQQALNTQLHFERYVEEVNQNALYVAEMVRKELYDRYQEDAYTQGFRVYTTVSIKNQEAATQALRKTLRAMSSIAYRGAENYLDLEQIDAENQEEAVSQFLSTLYPVDDMKPALIIAAVKGKSITVQLSDGTKVTLSAQQMRKDVLSSILNARMGDKQLRPGAVIRVRSGKIGQWSVTQIPELQGALVSLDAHTGAVRALVGGYDFHNKTFNRATQAWRQPGSSFKPFVYSAGLAKGMTAATIVNDAPIVVPRAGPGGRDWTPKNSDGRYSGPISLRQALTASKNMVSIRIVMAIGVGYTQKYIQRFGFNEKEQPANLSMALGSGVATPMQMAEGYAIFANGGYRVVSHVIDRIYDSHNRLRVQMKPTVAGETAPQAIDPRNAYVMYKMMQDVVKLGTARGALALGRSDIAGKTGTTNDNKDAWFVGFNPDIVTAVYIGYDTPRKIGANAFGGTLALPVWVEYMRFALDGRPVKGMQVPPGMVSRGGEYFLKEQQSTSSDVKLDNSASRSIDPSERDNETRGAAGSAADVPQNDGGTPVPPLNTPPRTGNGGGNGSNNAGGEGKGTNGSIDSLF